MNFIIYEKLSKNMIKFQYFVVKIYNFYFHKKGVKSWKKRKPSKIENVKNRNLKNTFFREENPPAFVQKGAITGYRAQKVLNRMCTPV